MRSVISRQPVYPTQPGPLQNQISKFLHDAPVHKLGGDVMGLVVPDSNLLKGGPVAAEAYKLVQDKEFDTVVLISPSHMGQFGKLSICSIDCYHTPLGKVPVNDTVRNELCDEEDDIYLDDTGHYHTEGVDVQLPYLQTVLSSFDVVPIVMGEESPEYCRELGHAVGEVMFGHRMLLIATADVLSATEEGLTQLVHYFSNMDVSQLMHLFNSEEVLVEGKGPILVLMIAALRRGANRARVLRTEAPALEAPGFVGAAIWAE